ncbi:MAG: CBS domain-containing protein [Alphaproteobacteria bacterium]|nr:CBS domain-containing protein [Alphaproteobacteria bacterium]
MSERGDKSEGGGTKKSIGGWLRSLVPNRNGEGTVREVIEELIEDVDDEDSTQIGTDEGALIVNILKLHELTAEDVMVPRADIIAADIDSRLDELVNVMTEDAHSRLPVYSEQLDNVAGFVHIKDVLVAVRSDRPVAVKDMVRDILFAAPSIRVLDLLLEMRARRTHMAIVVDEFGGVDGLVTIEDLVEEIVGEIEDEHDTEGPSVIRRPDGSILADARTEIEELEKIVGAFATDEEHEEIDTLGGIVFSLIDRVPRRNEVVAHPSGLEFQVVDADSRRVKRLCVRDLRPTDDE